MYLDNAATSWPKPPEVHRSVSDFIKRYAANPSRAGHSLAIDAGRKVLEARIALSRFFGVSDPLRVVFTGGMTVSLNIVLQGMLKPGDRVLTSSMEHNSVMRPLRMLEESRGVTVEIIPCSSAGLLDPDDVRKRLKKGKASLLVLNHASNVCGTVQPVREIAAAARERGVPVLLDTAQSAGCVDVDIRRLGVDILAFSGHKGLLGPTGIGGLVFADEFDYTVMEPLYTGGTGSRSESDEHPDFLPDRFEAGTLNSCGIAGLLASVTWLEEREEKNTMEKKRKLTRLLVDGLDGIPGLKIQGDPRRTGSAPVLSFIIEGYRCDQLGGMLNERYGIMCRVGLHCSPWAHRTLGTYPSGTVRFSPGVFNTGEEMETAVEAVAEIVKGGNA